jgi:hypothetical protein
LSQSDVTERSERLIRSGRHDAARHTQDGQRASEVAGAQERHQKVYLRLNCICRDDVAML